MDNRLSGGFVSYYLAPIPYPQRPEQAPYTAECEDIIEALRMNPDEANIFKEIWRTASERLGNGKPGNTPIRAAEKYVHYGQRLLRRARREHETTAAQAASAALRPATSVGPSTTACDDQHLSHIRSYMHGITNEAS